MRIVASPVLLCVAQHIVSHRHWEMRSRAVINTDWSMIVTTPWPQRQTTGQHQKKARNDSCNYSVHGRVQNFQKRGSRAREWVVPGKITPFSRLASNFIVTLI